MEEINIILSLVNPFKSEEDFIKLLERKKALNGKLSRKWDDRAYKEFIDEEDIKKEGYSGNKDFL